VHPIIYSSWGILDTLTNESSDGDGLEGFNTTLDIKRVCMGHRSGPVQLVRLVCVCLTFASFVHVHDVRPMPRTGVNQVSLEIFEAMARDFEDEIGH
jgi:hypothetical protein